jgi:hypothetical protein
MNGIKWIRADPRVSVDTAMAHLGPPTRYSFRFRRVPKEGVGDRSKVASLLLF